MQTARKGASRLGLIRASCPQPYGPTPAASSKIAPGDFVGAQARNTLLRALAMITGIARGRAPHSPGQWTQKRDSWILLRPLLVAEGVPQFRNNLK